MLSILTTLIIIVALAAFALAIYLFNKFFRLTEELERYKAANAQAQTASQSKTLYLANMSHEIRTPLGVIIGLAETLRDPDIDARSRDEYLATIEKTSRNLTKIINEVLDISKVEAGHIEIEKSVFRAGEFISELSQMLQLKSTKCQNKLVFEKRGYFPFEINTDRTRLRQILINLIHNSLKFTREGLVTVGYWTVGTTLYFEVSDTGPGIGPEIKRRLFQPFSKGDLAKEEGTGLGLVLCKKMAQALGGDVTLVRSDVGQGSTFLVCIESDFSKVLHSETMPAENDEFEILKGKKILAVDDSQDNLLVVQLHLARKGTHVDFALDGLSAVEKASAIQYDAILLDIQMPTMDGLSAAKILRENGYHNPIIALTAQAMTEDRLKCMAAGCTDYLSKPVDSKTLYSMLRRHLCPPSTVAKIS